MAVSHSIAPAEAGTHRGPVLLLIVVCLALFLPGFASLPPMDRDEPRFAQASKQMLETGDVVDIRFQGEARNKKPVGIYWLQATAVSLGDALGVPDARRRIWLYRLPSLLGAIVAVLATYWTALALTTRRNAVTAALLLSATILINVEARLAKTDATVLATVVIAMGALARLYLEPPERGRLRLPFIFWTAVAVGVLVKGPITPMVPAFAAVVLCIRDRSARWLGRLRPGLGLAWMLLLVLPWFVLILVRTHGHFLADSVGTDMLGKVAGGQEAHGAPPGTYLAAFWATGWPMTPFVALAIPAAWRARREPAVAFLLAWLAPTWLLFEAVTTKLPHYVLPTYPALAILAVMMLDRRTSGAGERSRWAQGLATVLLGILPVALVGLLLFGNGVLWETLPITTLVAGLCAAAIALAIAVWAARELALQRIRRAAVLAAGLAFVSYAFIIGHLLTPAVSDRLALSQRLAVATREVLDGDCADGALASAGDHEPSLVFLTRTDLLLTNGAGAADFLKGGGCRLALVEHRLEPAFLAALGTQPDIALARRVTGIAINGGKALDIGVYVRHRQAP